MIEKEFDLCGSQQLYHWQILFEEYILFIVNEVFY